MDDLATFLRAQLEEDEAWARAASQAYPYAQDGAMPSPDGVHWTWVAGEDWTPVRPDPGSQEFVAEPGHSCNLATVETWPSAVGDWQMPRTYANEIVQMDASAAGHIIRHDPARVLREVEAKRRILEEHLPAELLPRSGWLVCRMCGEHPPGDAEQWPCLTVRLLAQPYSDRPGYRPEWSPEG